MNYQTFPWNTELRGFKTLLFPWDDVIYVYEDGRLLKESIKPEIHAGSTLVTGLLPFPSGGKA
jgi:hypothetical protein